MGLQQRNDSLALGEGRIVALTSVAMVRPMVPYVAGLVEQCPDQGTGAKPGGNAAPLGRRARRAQPMAPSAGKVSSSQ